MNYRLDSFARKFWSAKLSLGTPDTQGVVSFKYRDDPVGPSAHSQFGGQAWLVTDKAYNRAILVEHESGLEILSAIGSVASLIALLPLISSGWAKLRPWFFRHGDSVEIRQLGQNNVLIEQRTPSVEVYVLNATLQDYGLLKQQVVKLEAEIESLKKLGLPSAKSGNRRQDARSPKASSECWPEGADASPAKPEDAGIPNACP
ncbi:MAG: hypothetical protein ACLP6G_21355 [Terriglobales bacterium]